MGTKENIPKNEAAQSEEEKTVRGWIAELDGRIKKVEADLKFATRQGIDSASLKELSEELKALKLTRKEYGELLGEA